MPTAPLRRTVRAMALAASAVTVTSVATVAGAAAAPSAVTPARGPAVAPTVTAAAAGASDPTSTFTLKRGQQLVKQGSSSTQPSVLRSGGLPSGSDNTINSGFGTYLVLQSDGNLVEYETTTGAVLFATYTSTGSRFVYQTDGNLVLYDAAGAPLFNTGTNGDTRGAVFAAYGNGQLVTQTANGSVVSAFGRAITPGPGVVVAEADSPSGSYRLVVQSDGNLVAYTRSGRPFWYTGTAGAGRVRLVAQSDGNLVLYSYASGAPVWYSGTSGAAGGVAAYYQLDMQDDGNIVLYLTNGQSRLRPVWWSGTRGVS